MDVLSNSVLVLNASYEPINVVSAKRALVLICKGAAIVQEKSAQVLRTARMNLPLPAVIRLLSYRNIPRRTHAVSRKGIMLRDGYACQYCQRGSSSAKLTLDHVTPKSRGGKSTWENLVACCYPCNNRKGDRTPAEARMPLARQPKQFGVHARHKLLSQGSELWGKYLFC
jgi:5-methylcytosine-specific restriction endonuclease McrA